MKPATKKALMVGGVALVLAAAIGGTAYAVTHMAAAPETLSAASPSAQLVQGHRYQLCISGIGAGITTPTQADLGTLQAEVDQQFGAGLIKIVSATTNTSNGGTACILFDYLGATKTLTVPAQIFGNLPATVQITVTDQGTTPSS